jgi:tetrapyrrole methylase family protein/MazG family protein
MEAIDLEDDEMLREELGDVLLQVAFHCVIETEKNTFCFDDVCDEVCKKLIVRHPHVFGDVSVENTEDVLKNWDQIKKETKNQETYTDTLKGVAKTLPALMRAQKVGKRAMRAGIDYESTESLLSIAKKQSENLEKVCLGDDKEKINTEFGKLMFLYANIARKSGIDPELSLSQATDNFISEFESVEKAINSENEDMSAISKEKFITTYKQIKNTNN